MLLGSCQDTSPVVVSQNVAFRETNRRFGREAVKLGHTRTLVRGVPA